MCKNFIFLILLISEHILLADIIIKRDAISVQESGIFNGCHYGPSDSISDHPPVIFKDLSVGTWNITLPVSKRTYKKGKGNPFVLHKFLTDKDFSLLNKNGLKIPDEMSLNKNKMQINNNYLTRVKQVINKIKNMMNRYNLNYMAIQELPKINKKIDKKTISKILTDIVEEERDKNNKPLFSITFAKSEPNKKTGRPDVGIIAKNNATRLLPNIKNMRSRLQAFCDDSGKTKCIISAHVPFSLGNKEILNKCNDIKELSSKLLTDYKQIIVTGDFNTTPEKISSVCQQTFKDYEVTIKAPRSIKNNCSNNKGKQNNNSIDYLMDIKKKPKTISAQ